MKANVLKIINGLAIFALFAIVVSVIVASIVITDRNKKTQDLVKVGENAKLQDEGLSAVAVAGHNTPTDCWMIISDKVYNLTPFLNEHPGGSLVIAPYCGKTATNAFASKDKNPAVKHSELANTLLEKYFIGNLGQVPVFSVATPIPVLATANILTKINLQPVSVVDVTSHNTTADCWIIVSNKIYNVTSYLVTHPGGVNAVAPYCGKNATSAFATKDKSPGVVHSAFAQNLLNSFFIANVGATSVANLALAAPHVSAATPVPAAVNTQTNLSSAEVSTHNTAANCWLIISGKVYNVTGYLVSHPGGVNAITPYCGQEATNAFSTRGGKGSNHSTNAYNLLNQYLVGTLGSTVSTTTSGSTPTPIDSSSCQAGIPSSICTKYPGSTIKENDSEDDGRSSWKINYQGGCRDVKLDSSGQITSDKNC